MGGPAVVKLPNAVRNRVKKARGRLRDIVASFLAEGGITAATVAAAEADLQAGTATAWQQGIVDGSIELPVWSPADREGDEKVAKEAKEPKGEENLDDLLAEFGVDASVAVPKKSGGKKKRTSMCSFIFSGGRLGRRRLLRQ